MAGRMGKVAQIENEARAQAEAAARAEAERQREHQRTLAEEAHRREVAAFMKREGLATVEDCRAYIRKHAARMRAGSFGVQGFERWCEVMKQEAVDRMALMDTADDRRVLERMRDAGVIDEANRLVPHEKREEVAAARRAQRAQAEEELRAMQLDRAMGLAP